MPSRTLAHLSHQPGRAFAAPGLLRRQRHVHVSFVQPGRIDSQFVGTGAGHDAADLWNAAHQLLFDAKIGLRRFVDRDGRILADRHHRGALVHHRHEGLADLQVGHDGDGQTRPHECDHDHRVAHRAREQRIVDRVHLAHQPGSCGGPASKIGGERRDYRHRQDQGGAEREHDCERHRTEQPPSRPCSASSGRKTVMMMTTPDTSGIATSRGGVEGEP